MVKSTVLERLQLSKKKIIREGGEGGGGTEKGLGKDGQTQWKMQREQDRKGMRALKRKERDENTAGTKSIPVGNPGDSFQVWA